METVRSDLKKILLGSADLLNRAGSLQAPSWKFPEKLAVSLDVEEALREGQDEPHSFILELVIDRLLVVLQCCVLELEAVRGGHRSHNIPLTLGSAVKRLSKCVIQNASHALDLKEQVSSKTKQIASVESSFSELQQECKVLQEKLQSSATAPILTATTGADYCQEGDQESRLDLGASRSAFVPREVMDVCTQTTDTAFALCAQCSATQLGLIESARLVSGLCEGLYLDSRFLSYNWNALAKIGGLEIADWCEALRIDVRALDKTSRSLLDRIEALTSERDKLNEDVSQLKGDAKALDVQLNSIKSQSDATLSRSKKEFAVSLASLESARTKLTSQNSKLRSQNTEMRKELETSQHEVERLSSAMAELETTHIQLERDLHAVERREQELVAVKQNLEEQLDSVMRQSQEALSSSQVEMNKYKLSSETLEKKHERMRGKQSALLSQLDTLHEECANLRKELFQVEESRLKLANDLKEAQARYEQVQSQLSTQQSKLSEANQEQDRLNTRLINLETQLADTKEQVEAEKRNCRLLMDYPYNVKQTEGHVIQRQQSRRQISANTIRILLLEEQNNELRNSTIREVRKIKQRNSESESESDAFKVSEPMALWEDELVSEIQEQQAVARNSATKKPTKVSSPCLLDQSRSSEVLLQPSPKTKKHIDVELPEHAFIRKNSAPTLLGRKTPPLAGGRAKLKGRLGHLVAAVAHSHSASGNSSRDSSYQPADFEVYLCDKCDRMFCLEEDMQKHSLSCVGLAQAKISH